MYATPADFEAVIRVLIFFGSFGLVSALLERFVG